MALAANGILRTFERFADFLACQRSWLSCMANQLSGDRPSAFDRRNAISGLTALRSATTRAKVSPDNAPCNTAARGTSEGLKDGLKNNVPTKRPTIENDFKYAWPQGTLAVKTSLLIIRVFPFTRV